MTILDIPKLRFLTNVRRCGAIAMMLTVLAGASGEAHALEDRSSPSQHAVPSACSPPGTAPDAIAPVPLSGALFTARRVAEGLAWDARYIVDVDAAFDFRGGVLALAVPLAPGEQLLPTPGVEAIREGDRVVGLCVAPGAIDARTVSASFLQPVALLGDGSVALGAPVAKSSAVQIIDTSLAATDARLDVTAGKLLERHVGYVAPRGVGLASREEARRLTETPARMSTSPVFVRGEDVRAAGGLTGRIVDPRARARGSALGVGILFATIVGGLVLAARKLQKSASVEHADALLASEIDAVAKESR